MTRNRFFQLTSTVMAVVLLATLLSSMGGQEQAGNLEMIERSAESVQPSATSAAQAETTDGSPAHTGDASIQSAVALQNSFRSVSQAVLPAVVEVNVVSIVEQLVGNSFPFFGRQFGGEPGETREFRRSGLGSGVIVARDGSTVYVLTNHHVIADADEINIGLYDGRSFDVEVVGSDGPQELVLVSFDTSEDVPLATLGDSDNLMVGDWVLAVGNPFGFESTVTAGIVSAIAREADLQNGIAGYNEYIQTDAAINRGNSGGALVNIFGEVVGINSWIASPSGGSIGLGFAIPINAAKDAIQDFVEYGGINYGWLGVSIGDVPEDMREELRLGDEDGSFVYNIYLDGPAAKAGILPGDLISAVDGQDIESSADLAEMVAKTDAGTEVGLSVVRQGAIIDVELEIGLRPQDASAGVPWPGLSAVSLTEEMRNRLGSAAAGGDVVIASVLPESPAAQVGLRSGDIIVEVDDIEVGSILEFYRLLAESRRGGTDLTVARQGRTLSVELPRR